MTALRSMLSAFAVALLCVAVTSGDDKKEKPEKKSGTVTGEVTAMTADPSDPSGNTVLLGSANGGVWRTTDGGSSWTPLTDNLTYQNQPINTPIGAIAFSPCAISSIASQQACAVSCMVRPGRALGERP